MKSVHITNFYHKNSGGISTSYNNLLEAAGRHRRYARLIVPGETEAVEEVSEFAKIYFVPARYSPIFDKRYRIMMPWQYTLKNSVIRNILLAEMPDMIEVTDKYTLSPIGAMIRRNNFKRIGRPMLVHFSCERMDDNIESFLTSASAGKGLARRVIANYTLPGFDFHLANSAYTAAEFYAALDDFRSSSSSGAFLNFCWQTLRAPRVSPAERIFVCPRGVDNVLFTPARRSPETARQMRTAANLPADAFVLLYAGRISPEKNIGLLVDLMRLLSADTDFDFRLLVAGDGPQAGWLKAQADKYFPGRLYFLGHLAKETLADYYANADVFVHPNPKEPFGIAPLEAMASGAPTVEPNAGGILSYATNENAWLAEPNGASFAAAVREAAGNRALREKKAAKAVMAAAMNTREAAADRLFATYDRLYEDFQQRKALFADFEAAKSFDFARMLRSAPSRLEQVETE